MRIVNISVVIVFLVAMGCAEVFFSKRNNNTDDYFLGGRRIPGWVVGLSMPGTSISSVTFPALPAAAFSLDYRQATPNLKQIARRISRFAGRNG